MLGPGPYPEWANTYDGLHMYRPGERAGWRRREDPGGLEMRVASAARPGLEAGVDFGRAWRSAGRGSDQLTPSRSAPATAWVEAANGKRRRNPSCQARRADEKGRRGVGTEGLIRAGKVRCRGIYSSGKT